MTRLQRRDSDWGQPTWISDNGGYVRYAQREGWEHSERDGARGMGSMCPALDSERDVGTRARHSERYEQRDRVNPQWARVRSQ